MNFVAQLFQQHPYSASVVSTWLFNNVVSVMVSNLPAPTKDSSAGYTYWFKVLNGVIGNIARAKSTAVESSPNWQDAVQKHVNGAAVPNSGNPQP